MITDLLNVKKMKVNKASRLFNQKKTQVEEIEMELNNLINDMAVFRQWRLDEEERLFDYAKGGVLLSELNYINDVININIDKEKDFEEKIELIKSKLMEERSLLKQLNDDLFNKEKQVEKVLYLLND